eukprot:1040857-Alexandrium_andersonii.AAC.1
MEWPCASRADRLPASDFCLAASGDGIDPACACFACQARRRGLCLPALQEPARLAALSTGEWAPAGPAVCRPGVPHGAAWRPVGGRLDCRPALLAAASCRRRRRRS